MAPQQHHHHSVKSLFPLSSSSFISKYHFFSLSLLFKLLLSRFCKHPPCYNFIITSISPPFSVYHMQHTMPIHHPVPPPYKMSSLHTKAFPIFYSSVVVVMHLPIRLNKITRIIYQHHLVRRESSSFINSPLFPVCLEAEKEMRSVMMIIPIVFDVIKSNFVTIVRLHNTDCRHIYYKQACRQDKYTYVIGGRLLRTIFLSTLLHTSSHSSGLLGRFQQKEIQRK